MANPPRVPSFAQAPSVGRVVHFIPADAENLLPWAAIVAGIEGDKIALHAFPPNTDAMRVNGVPYSDEPKAGCWNWPPRV